MKSLLQFLLHRPKRAHVVRCENCSEEFWCKFKHHYKDNTCPNCEVVSSLFVPDDVSITERERMYRFFEDAEKEEAARFVRYCHQLESQYDIDMDYEGHWGDIDADFVGDISEEILEELK